MHFGMTTISYESIDHNPELAAKVFNIFTGNRSIRDNPNTEEIVIIGECPLFDRSGLSWDVVVKNDEVIMIPSVKNDPELPDELIILMLSYHQNFPPS